MPVCPECGGNGGRMSIGDNLDFDECGSCGGTGKVPSDPDLLPEDWLIRGSAALKALGHNIPESISDTKGLMAHRDEHMPFPRNYNPCPSCSYKAQNEIYRDKIADYEKILRSIRETLEREC